MPVRVQAHPAKLIASIARGVFQKKPAEVLEVSAWRSSCAREAGLGEYKFRYLWKVRFTNRDNGRFHQPTLFREPERTPKVIRFGEGTKCLSYSSILRENAYLIPTSAARSSTV